MSVTTFAAIDVGSNEISLKIYEISKQTGIQELDHVRYSIELGSDTYKFKKIRHTQVNELCEVLKEFTLKLKEYGVSDSIAYATSAIREASNKYPILDQIRLRCGINVTVISNSEQRFLCYKAIAFKEPDFNRIIKKGTAIVHAGSGSIQITLFQNGSLLFTQNIRLGSLRIRELLGNLENLTNDYNELLMEYINNELLTFSQLYLNSLKVENMIVMGEQLEHILAITKQQPFMKPIPAEEFITELDCLCKKPMDAIVSIKYTSKEQAALLAPAALIYSQIIRETKAKNIYLSDITLCDGIAAEYAEKKMKLLTEHDFTNDMICCAKKISKKYQCNMKHNENVEYLALQLFDSIRKLHGFGKRERLLLQIAVILHNCGSYINMNHSRENSYYIILSTEIIGLSHSERELIARIVRYHTEDFKNIQNFPIRIQAENYLKTAKLFAIFSIAHVLDKSHKQKIKEIKVSFKKNNLTITAYTLEDITLEYGLFGKQADFFEEIYGIHPHLKPKRRIT